MALACVARAVNAGSAAQGVSHQAAVVRQYCIRIGNGKHLSGLLESIALEGVRVLNHVHIYARFPEGEYLVIKAA